MKKIIAMLLAIVMVCALSVSAFAVEDIQAMGAQDPINVTGAFVKTDRVDEYWIDIVWTDMTFTYTEAKDEWNEDTLVWDDPNTGAWDKTTATITVTNRSSVAVDAVLALADAEDTVTLALDETELNLLVAEDNEGVATLTVSGTMNEESATALGSITITLADAA